jgi:DNA-binding protein H-NS
MRDYVSPEDFERVKKSIELFKVTLNERAKEAQQLADEHRTKVIELQKKFNKKLSEHRNDDLVFI